MAYLVPNKLQIYCGSPLLRGTALTDIAFHYILPLHGQYAEQQ